MFSSDSTGATDGQSTAGDAAITLLDSTAVNDVAEEVTIINEGSVSGSFRLSAGDPWRRLSAGSSRTIDLRKLNRTVKVEVKRKTGGSDMTGLFADTQ